MENSRFQSHWARNLGRGAYPEWALRPAVHVRDFWNGAVVYPYRDRIVSAAMEAPGHSSALPLHGVSVAPCYLYIDRSGVDSEHHHHPPARGVLGELHCADRASGILVL